jgi:peptidoglycan/LPS O-acetylase OafA/YrhL
MEKLPSLNGLRAISIVIVILFHLTRFNFYLDQDAILRIPIFNGRFGVNIFFLISGFLITSLLLREEENTGTISVSNFYSRRVLRIFPAYLFLLVFYFVLQQIGLIVVPGEAWLTALTYTKYLNYHTDFYTSHAWSLSIEENFYLFWPAIFLLKDKFRKGFSFFLILMAPVIRLFVFFHPVKWIDEQSLFTRIDSIATGCLFALYRESIIVRLKAHWDEMFYASIVGLCILPWILYLVDGTYLVLLFVFFGVLTGTFANILIGIIMMYSIYGPRGNWYKVLNSKVMNYIGILSYSLYLWQQFYVFKRNWWISHFPQNVLLIFLTAMFSYYVIEGPFLRLKTRFSLNRRKRMPDEIKCLASMRQREAEVGE